ncbi:hypothetical protein ACTFIR_006388 [Dictyostelium discoideum]
MDNEYNERLFWKVFKNKYLLNYILKNKCCYKSKKFKTITSILSMLKHKQYQLLICKLKADENLYIKDKLNLNYKISKIKDIEVFKEIYSLLLFKGFQNYRYGAWILFESKWGIRSVDLFDIHLKYHPERLQTYIREAFGSIFLYNHPKLIIKVLKFLEESINHNKPFTLTKSERNYFIIKYLDSYKYNEEWFKIILNIPISPTSIFRKIQIFQKFSSVNTSLDVYSYLTYKNLLPFGFNSIQTSFYYGDQSSYEPILSSEFRNNKESVYFQKKIYMLSSFCLPFEICIDRYIRAVKGEVDNISSSINSVLLYFKLYYAYKSIPTSIQTQINIIIENSKHRRCTPYQSVKQLFQLLINESKSIVLYAFYLKEYNEPIETIQLCEEIQLLLIYYMINAKSVNILKFLLKKHLKIKIVKLDLDYVDELYPNILFRPSKINKNNIIKFNKIYKSQKSIIIEDIDEKPLDDNIISTKEHIDLGNELSSKWKEISSNLIDNDMIVTIKDKETIDWLSDIETGGCSNLNIREALNLKLKQMKLDFSTSELLEYARGKFKQVIPILDRNKQLCNIHILRTHDDIVSIINRLNQSNFNNSEDLFKYYMIQIIQFGSRNSMKYLRLICDSIDELLVNYEGRGHFIIEMFNSRVEWFYISSYLLEGEIWNKCPAYHEGEIWNYTAVNHKYLKEYKKNKIPTQQTCQIINLSKIKVNFNHFPNVTSYLFQKFIELLNFEGVQFILDNLNGKDIELNSSSFKDRFHNRIYTCKYLYKDLIEMIQILIDKFKGGQLSLSNLSLILNYLFLKLIRVNNLTIDQIKTAYQLISNYIEIDSSKFTSYYYLKILSPIIESCITVIEDPTSGFESPRPFCHYDIDTSVYTFEHIFTNRNNNDLNQFIDSTIMDIVKFNFSMNIFSKMLLDRNNPRINLFLHYFEVIFIKKKKTIKPFLDYKLLKLIIKTFDLESFIKLDNLFKKYRKYLRRENNNVVNVEYVNSDIKVTPEDILILSSNILELSDINKEDANEEGEQEDANDDGEHENIIIKQLEKCYWRKPLSINMVEWFGIIIYKDFSDYPNIINYLFNQYKHKLEPYINLFKLKLLNQKSIYYSGY